MTVAVVVPALLAGAAAGALLLPPGGQLPGSLSGRLVTRPPPAEASGALPVTRSPLATPARASAPRPLLPRPLLPRVDGDVRPLATVVGAGTAVALVVAGLPAAVLLAGVAAVGLRAARAGLRARTVLLAEAGVREACSAAAAALRAGQPTADALEVAARSAGPAGRALRRAAAAARLGVPVEGILRATPEQEGGRVLGQVAAAWEVASAHGSGLAAVLERLGASLGRQAAQREEVEAQLSGSRTAARVLALLPVAGVGLAALVGADPLHVLLHTPLGVLCLAGAVLLDLTGLWWTARLVRRAGET